MTQEMGAEKNLHYRGYIQSPRVPTGLSEGNGCTQTCPVLYEREEMAEGELGWLHGEENLSAATRVTI